MPTTATSTNQPANPAIARTMKEGASFKQQSAIVSIAKSRGLNGHTVCEQVYKCELHQLTISAASALIDALKSGRAAEMAQAKHQPEAFAGETCCEYWAARSRPCARSEEARDWSNHAVRAAQL